MLEPQRFRIALRLCWEHKAIHIGFVILLLSGLMPDPVSAQTLPSTPVATDEPFPEYEMDLFFDPSKRSIEGSLSVEWTNTTGGEQSGIYFRLYPNADYYGDGETLVDEVYVDGQPVATEVQDDPTVLQVTPPIPIAAGDSITIDLQFLTVIPLDSAAGFGIFQHDSQADIWNLADWYPILAGYEPGTGWYLQEPTTFGDPTFSETSRYDVTIEIPDTMLLISTGETTATQLGLAGTSKQYIETGPAREFAMTLLPADVEQVATAADDVTIQVTLPRDRSVPGLAEFMAETAAGALKHYERWMGDYPSPELDISVADLSGANVVSWSGITWFGLESIVADGELSEEEKVGLAFVILHEVGHQWIADIVGSNNNDHGFMTEGLVNALAVLAANEIYGADRADLYLRSWVAGPYSSLLNDGRDGIADAPISNETIGVLRTLLVYGKAAVGFIAIWNDLGETAFLDALEAYSREFRFAISEPDDLLGAFEDAAEAELDELWSFWFSEADATRQDLDAVLDACTAELQAAN